MVSLSFQSVLLFLSLWLLFFLRTTTPHPLKSCKFDQIYVLGDSISDTGNLMREYHTGETTACGRLPYGQTFFRNSTGRCSDGLLMIDYIAMAAGLPLLPAYNTISSADFAHGINFAVAGATALSTEFLKTKGIVPPDTNSSLIVQLGWMSSFLNSTCLIENECAGKLKSALFMVGGIGGNDFNFGFWQGKKVEEMKSLVPDVVNAIIDAARKVIGFGATKLVVPGNFPVGCFPLYRMFAKHGDGTPDENGCHKQVNELAMYYNDNLKTALDKLRRENPNVIIVYADWFNAYKFLLQYAKAKRMETELGCCGANITVRCGHPEAPICAYPNRYMSWDGLHSTQEAYKIMAGWLLQQIVPKLNCRK